MTFAQRKSKSKVKLNFGLSLDFSIQLKVSLSESLSERLSQKLKVAQYVCLFDIRNQCDKMNPPGTLDFFTIAHQMAPLYSWLFSQSFNRWQHNTRACRLASTSIIICLSRLTYLVSAGHFCQEKKVLIFGSETVPEKYKLTNCKITNTLLTNKRQLTCNTKAQQTTISSANHKLYSSRTIIRDEPWNVRDNGTIFADELGTSFPCPAVMQIKKVVSRGCGRVFGCAVCILQR